VVWNDLKYGCIVYGRSSCALSKHNGYQLKKTKNFEQDHFIAILTDEVFNKESGTKTDFHLGVVLSKHKHGDSDIEIISDTLPDDIKEHFGDSMEPICYLVNSKPVIVKESKITKFSESNVEQFCQDFGKHFCDQLCSSRELLKETLFKNMQDYNLPNIQTLSDKCSCDDCGCLNPYQAKLMQGEETLSICPNHLNELQEFVADYDMTKQNIECLSAMQLKYAKMKNGEFEKGENEYTMVQLAESIEHCKLTIATEGGYCHEVKIPDE
jgi:hypothetical protein